MLWVLLVSEFPLPAKGLSCSRLLWIDGLFVYFPWCNRLIGESIWLHGSSRLCCSSRIVSCAPLPARLLKFPSDPFTHHINAVFYSLGLLAILCPILKS
jgi:hypothetical protein